MPPRGRARRRVLACVPLAVLVFLLLVPAAWAQGPVPTVTASSAVGGYDPLALTASNVTGALTVTVTDRRGTTATWEVTPSSTDEQTLTVDLTQPSSGSAPVNGAAMLSVLTKDGTEVLGADLTVDLYPPVPELTVARQGTGAHVSWDSVSAADEVTYTLEWDQGSGSWTTLATTTAGASHQQADLAPGLHEFRVTASVPSASGGANAVTGNPKGLLVEAPPAEEEPEPGEGGTPGGGKPDTSPPGKTPNGAGKGPQGDTDKGDAGDETDTPRKVSATGGVRRTVSVPSGGLALKVPEVLTPVTKRQVVRFEMPEVAAPPPVLQPYVRPPEVAPQLPVLPVPLPTSGGISVRATQTQPPNLMALALGAVALVLFTAVPRSWRRPQGEPEF